ncbi:phosphate/phosphite/phosphonate ABC transporter substrate-binding protein [Acidovorax sp. A1169]|uniref:phosphate/phosphite/phosphonate ABC transporter substrate-binding protein n=1 Tax=Acidovorax sp. A1169 TaxID=3059524 RepID=UPI002737DEA5|nr:phosphate/phosphite/phosphonate ABC transporter substrate-binding protein [Acidovorax sp. A1169]MDP4078431.1 phosphate/phosphite/phosphonate ABC transporter substrate-binding protein [Acidovorax sp. A1169]
MIQSIRKLALGCLVAYGGAAASAQGCDDPSVIRFASIPKSAGTEQPQILRPLMKELERVLQKRVEVVRTNSYAAVVEGLQAGNVDLAELGPASYALLMERNPYVTAFAALSDRKLGGSLELGAYRSLLIVRADSGLKSIKDLKEKSLSLTDPLSTSGALIPMQAVQKLTGQSIEKYFGRVTYAGSHLRAIEALQKGLVSAAFVSSARLDEHRAQKSRSAIEIRVIWESPLIPNDPFVYRSNLCRPLVEKIRQVFFDASPALQPMFEELGGRRFVPVSDADYQAVRELMRTR